MTTVFMGAITLILLTSCTKFVSIDLVGPYTNDPPISGYFSRPSGDRPFPAVIMLHGCQGLNRFVMQRFEGFAARYRRWRYATLILDSFGPRNVTRCGQYRAPMLEERLSDVFSALAFLAAQPSIDGNKVILHGHSYGGTTVGGALTAPDPTGNNGEFVAGIAYYPNCAYFSARLLKAPLLPIPQNRSEKTEHKIVSSIPFYHEYGSSKA